MSQWNVQPGGYDPQPGPFRPSSGGYAPQPGPYNPPPGGYAPQPGGYAPQPGGYAPQPGGFDPRHGAPGQGGHWPGPPQLGPQSFAAGSDAKPMIASSILMSLGVLLLVLGTLVPWMYETTLVEAPGGGIAFAQGAAMNGWGLVARGIDAGSPLGVALGFGLVVALFGGMLCLVPAGAGSPANASPGPRS